ncbi:MAG: nitrous oxide-stimulated promoter family protein [Phycisphaerae bacterium]|nr:nitrous oxide-stimulated promoter family protein [Phycisphaerae bacterium]
MISLNILQTPRRGLPVVSRTRKSRRDAILRHDLRRLARFVELYCDGHHKHRARRNFQLKSFAVADLLGRPSRLCPACSKLLAHAFVKRTHCPFDPKPTCKHCPKHCYAPAYRAGIREVMRYAGRQMIYRGRVDFLIHLLF